LSWSGTHALVTGAQGFIGSWLVSRLLDEGAHVVVLRRDIPAESRFGIEGLEQRCDVVLGDLVDYESLVRTLNEFDVKAVFHLGAQTIVGTANRSPLSTWETNIRGTYTLLEACRAVGVVANGIDPPTRRTEATTSFRTARTSRFSRVTRTTCRRRPPT